MIETVAPGWHAPPRVRAYCTTRRGGSSRPPWDDFNLGLHVGDDAASVRRNRARLVTALGLPAAPDWIEQTHSTRVVTLERESGREADAAVTREPGRVAVVMIADCLPILVASRDGREVGAIHAGWRGLAAGVVEAALARLATPPGELLAWIGPGISRAHFEVGDDVRDAFAARLDAAPDYFEANRPGHWLCDLPGLAAHVLARAGVGEIERDRHCTYRDRERFYSYRRDGRTGRMAALIWIEPQAPTQG